jgi:hypothetical protein
MKIDNGSNGAEYHNGQKALVCINSGVDAIGILSFYRSTLV